MSAAEDWADWFSEQLDNWTTNLDVVTPSEWAEKNRYLLRASPRCRVTTGSLSRHT